MSVLDAEIKAVVFHKDGRRVTSMDENGTLCTWHIQTGIILDSASAPGYENYRCMAMNPEETEILIAGEYLMHYDLMSGKWQRNPYKIQDKEITSVTWFNEGKKIEIISLTARYEIDGLNKHIKIIYPFNDMLGRQWKEEFSNNARYRLSAERYRGYFYLALYDQKNGSCVQKISSCDDDFLRVKFSSDQKFILSLGVRNGELRRVPIEPNQFVREFRVENLVSEVKGLSPDGDFVYLSNDSVLQRWGLSEMKRRSVNIGSKQRITHLQCMKGPEDLLFCNDSGRIYLCNFNSATIFRSILVSPKSEHKTIAISRNQKFLVSAGFDGRIYLYDIKAGILFKTFSDSLRPSSFAIAPSGKMLFMGGSNQETIIPTGSTRSVTTGNIYLSELNLETGRRNRIIDYGKGSFKFIKVAPDNLSMVAGDVSNFHYNVKQYYFPDFQVVSTMQGLFREAMNAEFTHNSRYLSLCFNDGKITIFYLDNMRQNELHGHSNSVLETVFSPDDRFLFSRGSDHMVKAWDVSSGNELFSFLMLKDTGWFYLTPDRYYFASKIALKEMAWTIGMKKYDFEQFDLIYNRPDLVLAKIPYADTSLIPFYRKAYEKRLKKAGFTEPMLESGFHVPEIQITNIIDIPAKTDQVELKVRIKATDNRELLRKLHVWVNEVPVYGQNGLELSKFKSKSLNKNLNLKLSQGTNKIAISVLNAKGAESTKETFTIEYQPKEISKPNLYVISISVSKYSDSAFNLQYAVKDGRDIVNLFKNKQERFGKVIVDSLFDQQVNLEHIKSLKQKLMNTTVDDEVVIFISGHGLLDNQLNFYFASHQMDFNNPAENGIPYEALEDLLDGIPARNKLMLMDACHSGETDIDEQLVGATDTLQINNEQTVKLRTYGHKGAVLPNNLKTGHVGLQNSFELMKVLFSEMDHGNGTVIISAAAGMGYAYESPEWNNGVFTYCVLNGMKNMAADINNDLEISVSELKTYVSREVENLTFGKQKPTSRRENISVDFRIW